MITKSIPVKCMDTVDASSPIAMLVQIASKHNASIYLAKEGYKINAKSIMGMMSLKIMNGSNIDVIADGTDEEAAIADMEKFLTAG